MMDFIKSKKMKISLNKADQAQLSSPEKIQQALDEDQAFAFDICAGETVIGFALLRPFGEHAFFLWDFCCRRRLAGKGLWGNCFARADRAVAGRIPGTDPYTHIYFWKSKG